MSLYESLKDHLLEGIIRGVYEGGSALPTEQQLCEMHKVSRVTVRKALDELKKDGLVVSVQGQGTTVADRRGGYPGALDLIALIAATHTPFFADFMEHFEKAAELSGSLVMFKQDFQGDALRSETLFYRMVKMRIRNVVFWPQTDRIDFELLRRLRTVGMNMVLFDQAFETMAADVVSVNHEHAVAALVRDLRERGAGNLLFVGFQGNGLPSVRLREDAFRSLAAPGDRVATIPWGRRIEPEVNKLIAALREEGALPGGLIGCNGPVGLAAAKAVRALGLEGTCRLAAIDLLPEMEEYRMTAYRQPMKELAETAYRRLIAQSNEGEHWRARQYLLRGDVVRFG